VTARQMSIEEKVAAMRDVALAIQEAHSLGIVHRDLKPGNVLVERRDDGRWFPIVTDFGLARETSVEARLTGADARLGTPQYMSPEQARCDIHAIDRRSDVYGLGATLYELLTGRPPFVHPSLPQLLAQVIQDEPVSPRRLVPTVPVDLETVALKCLAKDPAQRYPSARALADDLGRYLAGEPIAGRRLPVWQRVRMRARRHRALVVLGACSLVTILAVAALGVRQWLISRAERARAAERTVLAQQLGLEAKDIELFLRIAYLLPLQDTRPARDIVRARMHKIAAAEHDLGPLGDALVHDALGRGHLALHEWQEAADELARVSEVGLSNASELHAARGQALGELYHRALEEARHSGDPAWLVRRRRELEQQYLMPALAELARSGGSQDHAAYLAALIALYRGEFAVAEQATRAEATRAPWLFEARKLAADAVYGAAMDAFDRGDYDAARARLVEAEALYAQASEIARSDAELYEAAARAALQRAEIAARQGGDPRESLEHALGVIDRALEADPDDASAYTTKAYVLLRWYRTASLRGTGDQRPLLDRIAQAAERAVQRDARDAGAWDALGNAHVYRGSYEHFHAGDAAPWCRRALDEIGRALAIRPDDPWANNDLGVVHRWLGSALDETGRDPSQEYTAALHSYRRATAIDPAYVYAWSNQVDIHASLAGYQASHGIDPHQAVEDARDAGEQCLAVDPHYDLVLDHMAQAELSLAGYLVDTGGDPAQALHAAQGFLDRADALHPHNFMTWFHRIEMAGVVARSRLRDRVDPSGALASGRTAVVQALQLKPDSADAYVQATELDLSEAEWAIRSGRDATPLFAKARSDAEQAIKLDGQFSEAHLAAAKVWLQIAMSRRSADAIRRGLGRANQALAINPRLVGARRVQDALEQLSSTTPATP
jgi:hypothetical protein